MIQFYTFEIMTWDYPLSIANTVIFQRILAPSYKAESVVKLSALGAYIQPLRVSPGPLQQQFYQHHGKEKGG